MSDQAKKGLFQKADAFISEFLKRVHTGAGSLIDDAKAAQPLKPIFDLLQKHNGNIEPVLKHLESAKDMLHTGVREHPEIAAIATALAIRQFKQDESRTRAFFNALCLRKIFRGEAGFFSKAYLALEGRDAGSAAAGLIQDTAADVVASVSRFNEADVTALLKIVKKHYAPGSAIYIDQNDWNLNGKEKDAVREGLGKMGFADVQFVRQTENVGTKVGGWTGMGIVYALAGSVSNSMKPANNAPAPLAPTA